MNLKKRTVTKAFVATIPAYNAASIQVTYLLKDNPKRIGLYIENAGSNPARLSFGEEASSINGIALPAGRIMPLWQNPGGTPTDMVSVYSELGTSLSIIEVSSVDVHE